ncbi:TesA [Acrasis kona]|uniref:TesA n=1 Tax=Acrasis kona TaxID=1008807 RepID=A0AAW2Z6E3_9EUKA
MLNNEHKGCRIYNAGKNGETSQEMTSRLPLELRKNKFEVAIILGGTNDIAHFTAIDIFSNIKRLHEIALENVNHSLAVSIPCSCNEETKSAGLRKTKQDVNNMLKEYASGNERIQFVDLFNDLHVKNFKGKEYDIWDDQIHLTSAGYNRMAEMIWPKLVAVLDG